jgi:succinyl-diaminopimelate desuccinylase
VPEAPVVALARELVGIDTINPPGHEGRAAAVLGERLEAASLEVATHDLEPGRPSVVARWPGRGDEPALCLTGHLDTVPLGGADWARDPLEAEIDGDRLYGRGASDMKGGTAAIVVAAERVAALGRGRGGLELVLTAAEETGCLGALALANDGGALGRAGAMLVAEPTTNEPCVAHKGVVWLDLVARGRTAHGSMPHLGDNAIHKLARAITRLEGFRFDARPHDLLGDPTLNIGTASGGININSVPDRASAGPTCARCPGCAPTTSSRSSPRPRATTCASRRASRSTRSTPTRATPGCRAWSRSWRRWRAPTAPRTAWPTSPTPRRSPRRTARRRR